MTDIPEKRWTGFVYVLHPNQVWMAEKLGWTEGKQYVVSKPLPTSCDEPYSAKRMAIERARLAKERKGAAND